MKPSNLIFPKSQKGSLNYSIKLDKFIFGNYALMALNSCRIKASHLEIIQLAIIRQLKKEGKLIFRVFPHTPVTKKPSEVRMGKGKGSVAFYSTKLQVGSFILEVLCLNKTKAIKALNIAASKLPLATKIITKS